MCNAVSICYRFCWDRRRWNSTVQFHAGKQLRCEMDRAAALKYMQAIPDPDGVRNWDALLLHCAGPKVQQVYLSLDAEAPEAVIRGPLAGDFMTPYRAMANRLPAFFAPKRNPTYERCVFKRMKQMESDKNGHVRDAFTRASRQMRVWRSLR